MKSIAYRFWSKNCPVYYVQNVKGRKGDWGYTTELNKALLLTAGQQIRFAADCRAVGVNARFIQEAA